MSNDPSREEQIQEQTVEVGQSGTHMLAGYSTHPADKVLSQKLGHFLGDPGSKRLLAVLDIAENLEAPSELVWGQAWEADLLAPLEVQDVDSQVRQKYS